MTDRERDLLMAKIWRDRAAGLSLKSSRARKYLRDAEHLEAKWAAKNPRRTRRAAMTGRERGRLIAKVRRDQRAATRKRKAYYRLRRKNPGRPDFSKMSVAQFQKWSNATFQRLKARHDRHVAAGEKLVPVRGKSGPAKWVRNPVLGLALANPAVKVVRTLSRRLYSVAYKHSEDGKDYQHDFGPGTSVFLLSDGSVLLKGPKPIWKRF